jgi:hypothetical protein
LVVVEEEGEHLQMLLVLVEEVLVALELELDYL